MLLKPLKKLIQGKLGSITPAVWACHLLTLRGRGNPYNKIVNSISILIATMLLKPLKKLILGKLGSITPAVWACHL